MDVQLSPEYKKKRRRRKAILTSTAAAALATGTYVVWSLEPAPLQIDADSVYIDTVRRGPFVRSVRGPGTLVSEEIRWITAETDGLVEKVLIDPGTEVTPESVILVLSNPVLEQQVTDAELAWKAAQSDYRTLEVELASEILDREADLAGVEASWKNAKLQKEANGHLNREGLVPDLQLQQSELTAEEWTVRYDKARQRLAKARESHAEQLAMRRHRVEQQRAVYELRRRQLDGLAVRSDIRGVLQDVPVEEGQRLTPGTVLARVARPDALKAELRIAETQTKDVVVGQTAMIDTRNGVLPGHVSRIDPAVQQGSVLVDVALDVDELPPGVRIDLSVDGTIELERLDEAVFVDRPAYGQAFSTIGLFKVGDDGLARRLPVKLGRFSVQHVEILDGLREGDRVILSDSSQWDHANVIRVR